MCLSVSADGRSFDSTIKGVRHSSVFGALILLGVVAVCRSLRRIFVVYSGIIQFSVVLRYKIRF